MLTHPLAKALHPLKHLLHPLPLGFYLSHSASILYSISFGCLLSSSNRAYNISPQCYDAKQTYVKINK
jgi:hypothetical protein